MRWDIRDIQNCKTPTGDHQNKLTTVQRLNFMEGLPTEKIIDTVLKMEITNLKATREELDIESIKDVVRYLVRARKIFVIGFRSSARWRSFSSIT